MTLIYNGLIAQQIASESNRAVGHEDFSADLEIEQVVRALLADSPEGKTAYIAVSARDGVVTLDGTVSDGPWLARFKNQVTSALPSVRIDDRLEWVVPECGVGFA